MQNKDQSDSKLVKYFSSTQGQEVMKSFIDRFGRDGDLFQSIKEAAKVAERNGSLYSFYFSLGSDISPIFILLLKDLAQKLNQNSN